METCLTKNHFPELSLLHLQAGSVKHELSTKFNKAPTSLLLVWCAAAVAIHMPICILTFRHSQAFWRYIQSFSRLLVYPCCIRRCLGLDYVLLRPQESIKFSLAPERFVGQCDIFIVPFWRFPASSLQDGTPSLRSLHVHR